MPPLGQNFLLTGEAGRIVKFDSVLNTFSGYKNSPGNPYLCVTGDASGNIIYAAGMGGRLSCSVDGGESWSEISTPAAVDITAIHFISATEIYLFHGWGHGKLYRYDGSSFTEVDFVDINSRVWAIWGTSTDLYTGWYYSGYTPFALRWWNGSIWQTDYSINGGAELRVYGGARLSDGSSLVVGTDASGGRKFFRGTYNDWTLEKNALWEGVLQGYESENIIAVNPNTGTSYILNADPYSPAGFYLYKRTAPGVYTTYHYATPDGSQGGGIALLDDNTVLIGCGGGFFIKFDGTTFTSYPLGGWYYTRAIFTAPPVPVPYKLDPILTEYRHPPNAYANVTQKSIPHSELLLSNYIYPPNAYANVTQKSIPHSELLLSNYIYPPNAYANVKETTLDIIVSSPDLDSTPYLEYPAVFPSHGAVDVPVDVAVILPCGDRVPEKDEIGIDLFTPGASSVPPRGLDPLKTEIWVTIGLNPQEKIYENGAPLSGWSISAVSNDYSGYERAVVAGLTYTLTPPSDYPTSSVILFTVGLGDYGGKYSTETYSFTTTSSSPVECRIVLNRGKNTGAGPLYIYWVSDLVVDSSGEFYPDPAPFGVPFSQLIHIEGFLYPLYHVTECTFVVNRGTNTGPGPTYIYWRSLGTTDVTGASYPSPDPFGVPFYRLVNVIAVYKGRFSVPDMGISTMGTAVYGTDTFAGV